MMMIMCLSKYKMMNGTMMRLSSSQDDDSMMMIHIGTW